MEEHTPGRMIDIPDDIVPYIFPGERIISIETVPEQTPPLRTPSSLKELYRLAQTKMQAEIGNAGPPLASLSLESTDVSQSENLHLYEALFGRDSLRVAIDTLPLYPRLARATIIALAELQGLEFNAPKEEEPGRIAHEIRRLDDPVARKLTKERGWQWPYYGSVDATPEFVRTIAAYCQNSKEGSAFLFQHYKDKNNESRIIADSLTFAVDWITTRLDMNKEGLLEYHAAIPGGIENQVWKDSPDAYFHADGTLANHSQGIASVEVQRVVFDALLDAAKLYENTLGRNSKAAELRARANYLKTCILDKFWCNDKGGYFVLGTDRDSQGILRQLKIRTSNMGHVLYSRLLQEKNDTNEAIKKAIVHQLFSPEMLNVSGFRTLATDEKRFRPGAYHNGSVWLWDTHLIAKGLRLQGYRYLAENIAERLFNIIDTTHTFPEFVRGDSKPVPTINTRVIDVWDETNQFTNRIEQPPQQVQAWSVAAIIALKHYRKKTYKPLPATSFEANILKDL